MPATYLKDIFREIKISLGRFLSILCIVAIGVAFFAGIKASAPDMKNSADTYFDKYNVQDIQVYSTIGLTKKDVAAIKKIKGVKSVHPFVKLVFRALLCLSLRNAESFKLRLVKWIRQIIEQILRQIGRAHV